MQGQEVLLTCSDSGVLNTLSFPKRCNKPAVQRKTPPKLTSSPNTRDLQRIGLQCCKHHWPCTDASLLHLLLLSNAICSASFTAVHKLMREVSELSVLAALVARLLRACRTLCILNCDRARPVKSIVPKCF